MSADDEATELSLCVYAFGRSAHLQLPGGRGGGVQSIGRGIRSGSGSGHGWGEEGAGELSSVGRWFGLWLRKERRAGEEGAPALG